MTQTDPTTQTDPHIESAHGNVTVRQVNGRTVRYYHHSQSPAAWVGVSLAALGFLLAAIGTVLGPQWLLIYIGAGLVIGSIPVTWILKGFGLGQG